MEEASGVDPLTQEILVMETQTWEALKVSGKELVPFLSSDCVMAFPGGTIFHHGSKPSLAEILQSPDMKPWTKYDIEDVHVIPLGRDAASITYSVAAERDKHAFDALVTSVWRRRGDSWELCCHQQTPSGI